MLRRFRHALEPVPQAARVRIFGVVELYLVLLRSLLAAERLRPHERDLQPALHRMLEPVELLRQPVDLGGGQLELQRQLVVGSLAIIHLPVGLENHLRVRGRASRKRFRIEKPRQITRDKRRGRGQYPKSELHRTSRASLRLVASCVAWQIAIASASDASSLAITSDNCNSDRTINCTWPFSARP